MPRLTRRAVLGSGTAAAALAATRVKASSATPPRLVIAHRDVGADTLVATHPATEVIRLEADVVRQWRSSLREQLHRAGSAAAYAPWAETQILAGLVREVGGRSQLTASDRGQFRLSIEMNQ